jgi:hypothetical protein
VCFGEAFTSASQFVFGGHPGSVPERPRRAAASDVLGVLRSPSVAGKETPTLEE